jgi:hypothetical protein
MGADLGDDLAVRRVPLDPIEWVALDQPGIQPVLSAQVIT